MRFAKKRERVNVSILITKNFLILHENLILKSSGGEKLFSKQLECY